MDELALNQMSYCNANDILTLKYGPGGAPSEGLEGGRLQNANSSPRSYPNPFSEKSELIFSVPVMDGVLNIFDASGRLIRSHSIINTDRFTIERGDMAPGTYFLSSGRNGKLNCAWAIYHC